MARLRTLYRRYPVLATHLITVGLALACYGFVFSLPFFYDDLPVMAWLSNRGWDEIWLGPGENRYYRPLSMTVYKLGRLLSAGADRAVLHGANLVIHVLNATLVMWVARLTGRTDEEATLASALMVVFPFLFLAVPWVTAMPHLLATFLTLLAVVAGLKAGRARGWAWWTATLLFVGLAPMAHESGYVCGAIVAAVLLITRGLDRRRLFLGTLGIGMSVAALAWRSVVLGAGGASFGGLEDWVGNAMFSLHGLVYPLAAPIGFLVRRYGIQDFSLVGAATSGLLIVLGYLIHRTDEWRWMGLGLGWWGLAMVPAAASLSYGYIYSAPRVYALASPGVTMLWSGVIISLSRLVRRKWCRLCVVTALVGTILGQNVAFLQKQGELARMLGRVYGRVLDVASGDAEGSAGFVNLPTYVAHREKTYAMILESVLFIPPYSDLVEFCWVNGVAPVDAVVYSPVVEDGGYVRGLRGGGLDWEEMRQFAAEHESVWLSRWRDQRLVLDSVGAIDANAAPSGGDPLVTFEGGAAIEAASGERAQGSHWALTIDWAASGPVDSRMFVHVRDAQGDLVGQADGPALGGMVPTWIWREGDRILDVRHLSLEGRPPYTLQVGLFNAEGRLPAYVAGSRCPDDVCSVMTFGP